MALLTNPHEYEKKILSALGLSEEKHVTRIEIVFQPRNAAQVLITRFITEEEANDVVKLLAEYEWRKVRETELDWQHIGEAP